ncbi:head maturation protease, ClpP-related [Roseovarius sp. SYSU LYC5161]|uniref:head maturation protease, ClpP-related n=1 Tax=Roseovarius halophilus (ex Wu et al. 2025) TaxID=3376060 RepID=UPI00399BADC5
MAIRIEGIIGEDATAAGVAHVLEREGTAPEVIVNSPGGSATEGAAIYAELRAYAAPVTILVRGIAASAASLLVMAGDTITIAPAASMMLHDPAAITIGNAAAHRASLAMLEELSEIYAATYAEASGQPVELVRQWMRAESWLSPKDAVALGFADTIEPEPDPQPTPAPERQTETMRALTALAAQPKQQPVATYRAPVMTL